MLETDKENAAAYCAFCLTRAVRRYGELTVEGYNAESARSQAIAYLRRKTGWAFHLAAGAFDAELRDQPNTN